MTVKFWKMHGAGNDFIVVADMRRNFPVDARDRIRELCRRPEGIGAEGMIVLRPVCRAADKKAEHARHRKNILQMLFFNPDGAAAAMCGNGARCAARLAADQGFTGTRLTLATGVGLIAAEVMAGGQVRINLTPPSDWRMNGRLNIAGRQLTCHCVDTGVPHAVLPVDNVARVAVKKTGAAVRYNPCFRPHGINVDFMTLADVNTLAVRTYERGVEDETGACGTGAAACALIAGRLGMVAPPVTVVFPRGDRLVVDYRLTGNSARSVTLTGPTEYVFEGRVKIHIP